MKSNFCVMCGEEIPEGGQVCPNCIAKTEKTENSGYWDRVCEIQAKQTEKGIKKYGQILEANTGLTFTERIQHIEEELIDALMYLEHLKESHNSTFIKSDKIDSMIDTVMDNYTFEQEREIFVEECAEAIKASQKCKRTDMGTDAFDNFCEEVADVCITAEQMRRYISPSKIDSIITKKLERQIERINYDKF